jgi:hypothetical protein
LPVQEVDHFDRLISFHRYRRNRTRKPGHEVP